MKGTIVFIDGWSERTISDKKSSPSEELGMTGLTALKIFALTLIGSMIVLGLLEQVGIDFIH